MAFSNGLPPERIEALRQASSASAQAADLECAEQLDMLSRIVIEYEWEIDMQVAQLEKLSKLYDAEKPGLLDRVWDHDVTKVGLFIAGVWFGREMVKVR